MSTTEQHTPAHRWFDQVFEGISWLLLALVPLLINVSNVDAYRTIQATYSTILLAIGLAAWAIARSQEKSWLQVRNVPLLIPLAAVLAWALLTVPRSPSGPLAMSSWWNLALYIGYFVALSDQFARDTKLRWRLLMPLMFGVMANAIAGLTQFQHLSYMDFTKPLPQIPFILNYFAGLDAPAKLGSAAGMLGNQNVLGGYLIGGIPMLLMVGLAGLVTRKRLVMSGLMVAIGVIACAALLATQTRGAWIGLAGGLLYAFVTALILYRGALKRISPKAWVGLALGVMVIVGGLAWKGDEIGLHRAIAKLHSAGTDGTSMQRLYAWGVAKSMADASPVVGQGLGTFKILYFQYLVKSMNGREIPELMHHRYVQAHNDFIQMAGELGYVGLLLGLGVMMAFCGGLSWWLFKQRDLDTAERMMAIAGVAGFISISVGGVFGFPFHIATSGFLATVSAAFAGGLWTAERRRRPSEPKLILYSDAQLVVYNLVLPFAIALFAVALSWSTWTGYRADELTKAGTELYKAGRLVEAQANLGQAITMDPERGDARMLMGLTFAMNGRFQEAEHELLEAERSYDDVTLHYYLGRIYESEQRPDKARDEYDHALHYFPARSEIVLEISKRLDVVNGILNGTGSVAAATGSAPAPQAATK